MEIQKIGQRNIVFRYGEGVWDLNLHLIVGEKYNYLVDTGLGSKSVEPIKEYLKDYPNPVIVINTHYHWDHVWGNHCFEDSMIIAHELCYQKIEDYWERDLKKNSEFVRGAVKKKVPNVLIEKSLYFKEDGVYIFYAPGHTPDGICVYDEKDKVLNVGDNIGDTMEQLIPDLQMDKETYLKSIAIYQSMDVEVCVSGHNQLVGSEVFERIENLLKSDK